MTASALENLLRIASDPTSSSRQYDVPTALSDLFSKNGFFAFEAALEVFPLGESEYSYSLLEWNNTSTWISCYRELAPEGLCFAHDLFGNQFLYREHIYTFEPETAAITYFSASVEEWAEKVLDDYEVVTGHSLAHAWQEKNGPLESRARLVPIIPFVLGGAYALDNLMVMEAAKAMQLRAGLALQIKNVPDGSQIIYEAQ